MKRRHFYWGKWLGLILLLAACREPLPRVISPSFYHWQSRLDITSAEYALLDSLAVDRLYLRLFDLDAPSSGKEIVPLAALQMSEPLAREMAIIPTVFITNRSLVNLPSAHLPDLVAKVARKIRQQIETLKQTEVAELQFDCDWTPRSRAIYFRFLTLMKEEFPDQQISATIRLHQVKYPQQTGVPPVDRGMLMFYNMGEVDDPATENSIFDWSLAEAYLGPLPDYPLALDLALPIFSWGVLFRDGQLTRLINNLRMEELGDTSRFKIIDDTWVELRKSTYLQGHYLYRGDRLRLEGVAPEDLVFAAEQLKGKINNPDITLAYYHLDSTTLKHFSYAHFQTIHAALAD